MNVSLQGLAYRNRVPGVPEIGGEFPTRLIGVFGLVRQTLLDARSLDGAAAPLPPELNRPDVRPSLEALRPVARRTMPLILPAREDREVRRAAALADELKLDAIVAGGYEAAAVADALKARRIPVLVSLDFPEREKDVHPAFQVPLRVVHYRQRAPRAAAELARAGVQIAFFSGGLASGSEYLAHLRRAVREGLPKVAALRAATLGAARILGVEGQLGSVEAGKVANLIVADGELLDGGSAVRHVLVAGQRYDVTSPGSAPADPPPQPAVADPFDALVPDLGPVVLFRNVSVMTVSHGTLKDTSLLVQGGKIAALGPSVTAPPGARVIDGAGRWITPGFIDCHSHIATDSHNESGANMTAMAGTPDTLNPVDIAVYRTLASGVTAANVLHGSVNAIGGRTIVIKNRWGRPASEMVFEGATPGLKFAIKEFGPRKGSPPPSSWMGVEAFLRDALTRARRYAAEAAPRRDLALEALAEVMAGRRFLHVHCYTPEEIMLVMRVAEDFGFKVRVFQHATQGYRVAEEIARHGGGASIFSDLGELNTPYNAAILMRKGVVVSVNSDGEDLARHFNHDVARLMKYGDLGEDEALAMITMNPAKQLAIDDRVGSIDVGKDADLVVFNRHPLSVYAVPEMVFIDGRLYFSREAERERERRVEAGRKALAETSDAR
jgi:imidazolonepropionase-like amidohydrolase